MENRKGGGRKKGEHVNDKYNTDVIYITQTPQSASSDLDRTPRGGLETAASCTGRKMGWVARHQ